MSLREQLLADLQQAMKDHDIARRDALRMTRAAIQNAEIEGQHELSDSEVLDVIAKQVKQRQESIEMFRAGKRDDLVAEEQAGITVLEEYLPVQLSAEEIKQVVQRIVDELGVVGPAGLGPVMKQAMAELRGRADGRLVNQAARDILSR